MGSFVLIVLLSTPTTSVYSQFKDFQLGDGLLIGGAAALDVLVRVKGKEGHGKPSSGNPKGIDKYALDQIRLPAKRHSDFFLKRFAPVGLVASQFVYDDFKHTSYLSIETILLNDLLNVLAKTTFRRRRPFTFNSQVPSPPGSEDCKIYDPEAHDASLSFYSGHTAHVAAFTFLTNTLLWYYEPSLHDQHWTWYATAAIPALVGYQRVRAGKHFPTDVIVGYLAGASIGYLVPKLHEDAPNDKDLGNAFLASAFGGAAAMVATFGVLQLTSKGKPEKKKCDCCITSARRRGFPEINIQPSVGGLKLTIPLR